MELFRIKRDLPFMKHALIFNVISFLTFAAAVFFLVTRGLHFSIEFTGGTVHRGGLPAGGRDRDARSPSSRWALARCRCKTSAPRVT